jgi:hypothetical protein
MRAGFTAYAILSLVAKIDVEGHKNGEATPAFGPVLPTGALQQVGFETAWQRQMTYVRGRQR